MIMYRVRETMFSGISIQEKEVVKTSEKTVTYIHPMRGEVRESKKNRSTSWFESYEEAKDCAVKQLQKQIKTHSRHLERAQSRLDELLGEDK